MLLIWLLPPLDAIYMLNNVDTRQWRAYGSLIDAAVIGGISCLLGNAWLGTNNMSVATIIRDAIHMYSIQLENAN